MSVLIPLASVVLLVSICMILLGMLFPKFAVRWGNIEKRTRKKAILTYGSAFIVSFVVLAVAAPSPVHRSDVIADTTHETASQTTAKATAAKTSVPKPAEPDFSVSDLDVMWEGYFGYITGTVKNNTNHAYRYAEININVYDESGAQIATPMSNTENLQAGGTWKFKAPIIPRPTGPFTYKVVKIHGMK